MTRPIQPSDPDATGGYYPSAAFSPALFAPGTVLAGRFRIVSRLGKGGMGEVYRADDLALGQPVALKFLPPELADDPERLARFRQEVATARHISHANVCRVFDIVEGDGRPFLTMEFIDGEDLASLLQRVGRLPEEKAVEVARQLCSALAAVHEQGLLHRDLKPHNVMIDGRGKVRLTDFGLAAIANEVKDIGSGTPAYMAPEQLAGQEVSVRSDLFALGLVLYEVFTGKKAFSANSPAELAKRYDEDTPSRPGSHISGLNAATEQIILRCLRKNPHDRPRSAIEVMAALPGGDPLAAALAAGETPSPEMVAAAGGSEGLSPRAGLLCLGGLLLGLVLIGLLASKASLLERTPVEKPPAELAGLAREVLRKLGCPKPIDRAWGFTTNDPGLRFLREQPPNQDRRSALATGQPHGMLFWYREAQDYLVPHRLVESPILRIPKWQAVTSIDPDNTQPGMVSARFDALGRLLYFHAIPTGVVLANEPQTLPQEQPDWEWIFQQAGLRYADFKNQPAAARFRPPIYVAGPLLAWKSSGVLQIWPDAEVRVEAAADHGKLVYLRVIYPWDSTAPSAAESGSSGSSLTSLGNMLLLLALLVGTVILVPYNLMTRKADLTGAARLAVAVLLIGVLVWVCRASHLPTSAEYYLLILGLSFACYLTLTVGGYYLAMEPYVRRLWPQTLISWNRLLAGRWRDPLVGRDLLVGCVAGIVCSLLLRIAMALPVVLGETEGIAALPFGRDEYYILLGARPAIGDILETLVQSIRTTLLFLLLLLLLRIVFRKPWLAALLFVLCLTALPIPMLPAPFLMAPLIAVEFLVMVVILTRFGVLATVNLWFVHMLVSRFPITLDLAAWYASTALFAVGVVLLLAGFGFYHSLAGRPLLGAGWLAEK